MRHHVRVPVTSHLFSDGPWELPADAVDEIADSLEAEFGEPPSTWPAVIRSVVRVLDPHISTATLWEAARLAEYLGEDPIAQWLDMLRDRPAVIEVLVNDPLDNHAQFAALGPFVRRKACTRDGVEEGPGLGTRRIAVRRLGRVRGRVGGGRGSPSRRAPVPGVQRGPDAGSRAATASRPRSRAPRSATRSRRSAHLSDAGPTETSRRGSGTRAGAGRPTPLLPFAPGRERASFRPGRTSARLACGRRGRWSTAGSRSGPPGPTRGPGCRWTALSEALALMPVCGSHANYRHWEDPVPWAYSRHATTHSAAGRQFSKRNAVQAVLVATGFLLWVDDASTGRVG